MSSIKSDSVRHSATYADTQHDPVTTVLPQGDIPYTDHEMTEDERVIMALGYKPEFKREFSLWTTFCVSFAVLGLLPSFASTMSYGMLSGRCLPTSLWLMLIFQIQEWDMLEQRVWSGAGSLACSSFSVLPCLWRSSVLRCLLGKRGFFFFF